MELGRTKKFDEDSKNPVKAAIEEAPILSKYRKPAAEAA